jgi:hypothetical protein
MRVFDVAGRLVHQRAWNGSAGLNDIFIRSEDLAGDGLYIFRLEGDTGSREGRLVLKRE